MLSFSSFGSTKHPLCDKLRRATELVRYADPTLIVDGEVQGDIAVTPKKMRTAFPFSPLQGGANVLIFPDLEACNIASKLLMSVGGAQAFGPILMGMAKPVHLLQPGVEVEAIVNMATIAVVDAQDTGPLPVTSKWQQRVNGTQPLRCLRSRYCTRVANLGIHLLQTEWCWWAAFQITTNKGHSATHIARAAAQASSTAAAPYFLARPRRERRGCGARPPLLAGDGWPRRPRRCASRRDPLAAAVAKCVVVSPQLSFLKEVIKGTPAAIYHQIS